MTAEAKDILAQINAGKWGWMKVKRFNPNAYAELQQRYDALEKHHVEETKFLVSLVGRLCRAIVGKETG